MKPKPLHLDAYYRSAWWARRSKAAKRKAGNRCQWSAFLYRFDFPYSDHVVIAECEWTNLDVHHESYDNLYAEKDDDLYVLCRTHHIAVHLAQLQCKRCVGRIFLSYEDAEYEAIELMKIDPNMDVGEAIGLFGNKLCEACQCILDDKEPLL